MRRFVNVSQTVNILFYKEEVQCSDVDSALEIFTYTTDSRQSPCQHRKSNVPCQWKQNRFNLQFRPPQHFWLSGVGTIVSTHISRMDWSLGPQVVVSPMHVTTIRNIAIKKYRPPTKWALDSNWLSVLSRITSINSFFNLLFILFL